MIFEDSCQSRSWMDRSLHLANEKGLETARTVVPLQSLAIPIPQLEAVFFLAVLVSVTKRIVDSCFLHTLSNTSFLAKNNVFL